MDTNSRRGPLPAKCCPVDELIGGGKIQTHNRAVNLLTATGQYHEIILMASGHRLGELVFFWI